MGTALDISFPLDAFAEGSSTNQLSARLIEIAERAAQTRNIIRFDQRMRREQDRADFQLILRRVKPPSLDTLRAIEMQGWPFTTLTQDRKISRLDEEDRAGTQFVRTRS